MGLPAPLDTLIPPRSILAACAVNPVKLLKERMASPGVGLGGGGWGCGGWGRSPVWGVGLGRRPSPPNPRALLWTAPCGGREGTGAGTQATTRATETQSGPKMKMGTSFVG